ncbi:hypothetical protein Pelo_15456 [Pelomyxa schiedti]|nr:hypothetical protein Pelo_15456 [Pelomyxa schiedti]
MCHLMPHHQLEQVNLNERDTDLCATCHRIIIYSEPRNTPVESQWTPLTQSSDSNSVGAVLVRDTRSSASSAPGGSYVRCTVCGAAAHLQCAAELHAQACTPFVSLPRAPSIVASPTIVDHRTGNTTTQGLPLLAPLCRSRVVIVQDDNDQNVIGNLTGLTGAALIDDYTQEENPEDILKERNSIFPDNSPSMPSRVCMPARKDTPIIATAPNPKPTRDSYTKLTLGGSWVVIPPSLTLMDVPTNLLLYIFSKLDWRALCKLSQVSKLFYELANRPALWKNLLLQQGFDDQHLELVENLKQFFGLTLPATCSKPGCGAKFVPVQNTMTCRGHTGKHTRKFDMFGLPFMAWSCCGNGVIVSHPCVAITYHSLSDDTFTWTKQASKSAKVILYTSLGVTLAPILLPFHVAKLIFKS